MFFNYRMKFLSFMVTVLVLLISSVEMLNYRFYSASADMEMELENEISKNKESLKVPKFCFATYDYTTMCSIIKDIASLNEAQKNLPEFNDNVPPAVNGNDVEQIDQQPADPGSCMTQFYLYFEKIQHSTEQRLFVRKCGSFYLTSFQVDKEPLLGTKIYVLNKYSSDFPDFLVLSGIAEPPHKQLLN